MRILLALGVYVGGVALALQLFLLSCVPCASDNAYVGLFLLTVVLAAVASVLAIAGIAAWLRAGPWIAAAGIPAWLILGVGLMIFVGNPLAALLLPLLPILGALAVGAWREAALGVLAAAVVGAVAVVRGLTAWGTLGFDPVVLGATVALVPVVVLALRRVPGRRAA